MNNNNTIFINLSNHPSAGWSSEQKEAAAPLGEIADLPFPAIDSRLSADEVALLAHDYVNKAEALADGRLYCVHVMGEMCFTHCFVSLMKAKGIACFASTTERMVNDKGNGVKEMVFRFVRFRQYI